MFGVYAVAPLPPSTCSVIPLLVDRAPPVLVVLVTMSSCFGPAGKAVLTAGTWITIRSATAGVPGVQLRMPPLARVSVVTLPVAGSVRLTWPPSGPRPPARPMKSASIAMRRLLAVSVARTNGPCSPAARLTLPAASVTLRTCSSSGLVDTGFPVLSTLVCEHAVPEIGSSGVSSATSVWPGQTSYAVVAVR
jgi:hypothetical protein